MEALIQTRQIACAVTHGATRMTRSYRRPRRRSALPAARSAEPTRSRSAANLLGPQCRHKRAAPEHGGDVHRTPPPIDPSGRQHLERQIPRFRPEDRQKDRGLRRRARRARPDQGRRPQMSFVGLMPRPIVRQSPGTGVRGHIRAGTRRDSGYRSPSRRARSLHGRSATMHLQQADLQRVGRREIGVPALRRVGEIARAIPGEIPLTEPGARRDHGDRAVTILLSRIEREQTAEFRSGIARARASRSFRR